MNVPPKIRSDFRLSALGNHLSPIRLIRSIAPSLSCSGRRNCSSLSNSTASVPRSIVRRLHQHSDDQDGRVDRRCRHE